MAEAEITSIESDVGAKLPSDYREFLTTYGQSAFGELVGFQPIGVLPRSLSGSGAWPFSHFYGSKKGIQRLDETIEDLKDRIPTSLIPIGDDGAGSQICIGLRDDDKEKVFFWDHDMTWKRSPRAERMPDQTYENTYLIAVSFEDFIRRLRKT
jgi:hypothetical protein